LDAGYKKSVFFLYSPIPAETSFFGMVKEAKTLFMNKKKEEQDSFFRIYKITKEQFAMEILGLST